MAIQRLKTVTLGNYPTPKEYRAAILRAGRHIDSRADYFINADRHQFPCASQRKDVELWVACVSDFGFEPNSFASERDILYRASQRQLLPCPHEVALALACEYAEQPLGTWLFVMSSGLTHVSGVSMLFVLASEPNSETLWLDANVGGTLDHQWHTNTCFVFMRQEPLTLQVLK